MGPSGDSVLAWTNLPNRKRVTIQAATRGRREMRFSRAKRLGTLAPGLDTPLGIGTAAGPAGEAAVFWEDQPLLCAVCEDAPTASLLDIYSFKRQRR